MWAKPKKIVLMIQEASNLDFGVPSLNVKYVCFLLNGLEITEP